MSISGFPYKELGQSGRGGMAVVYRATHNKKPGPDVAVKRPLPFGNANERLRREIDVMSSVSHPHVMPILDWGVDDDGDYWYAMPVARGSLKELWEEGHVTGTAEEIAREVLEAVSQGLGAMHDAGFIHRDVTPGNVLALDGDTSSSASRWVIADCGLVRRPVGETTLTLTGSATTMGTLGFIAPEAHGDPHRVTKAADVYSLGRILAWLLTGQTPVLTDPLLPDGAWRSVVREFTRGDSGQRPQSMEEARERAEELLEELPLSAGADFRAQIESRSGKLKPDNLLWQVVLDHVDDYDFMLDDVVLIETSAVANWTKREPNDAAPVAERMAQHLLDGDFGDRGFDVVNKHLNWFKAVLEALGDMNWNDLFEDVATSYCEAVASWNRFPHNDRVRRWLPGLFGATGDAMARAIRHSGSVDFFRAEFGSGRRFTNLALAGLLQD